MPIYEFACMSCESHFEELVRGDAAVTCPECGGANVRKQLSVFAVHGGGPSGGLSDAPAPRSHGGGCCGGGCGC
jgi:putative FmdB family regulatory protein